MAMGSTPLNLAFRFLLEVVAFAAMVYWGWTQHDGLWRFVGVVGVPLVAILLWGMFAVPGDPSRSGRAPVPIPGWARLVLELAIFGFAVWCLVDSGQTIPAMILGLSVLVHYALSLDRINWLLSSTRS